MKLQALVVIVVLSVFATQIAQAGSENGCRVVSKFAREVWEARQAGTTKEKALARISKADSSGRYIVSFAYELPADITAGEFAMYWAGFCQGKADAALPPVVQTAEPSAKIWTAVELNNLTGRSVEYLINTFGQPNYEGKSFADDLPYLDWNILVRSDVTHEIRKASISVYLGTDNKVSRVSISGLMK